MERKPINNYVYQPFGVDKEPYIYGVAGIDSDYALRKAGMTKDEAVTIAEFLNRVCNRPSRCNGEAIFKD